MWHEPYMHNLQILGCGSSGTVQHAYAQIAYQTKETQQKPVSHTLMFQGWKILLAVFGRRSDWTLLFIVTAERSLSGLYPAWWSTWALPIQSSRGHPHPKANHASDRLTWSLAYGMDRSWLLLDFLYWRGLWITREPYLGRSDKECMQGRKDFTASGD